MKTPQTDKVLSIYTLVDSKGFCLNENINQGQKEIMEIILNRGVTPEMIGKDLFKHKYGDKDIVRRAHVMAHTRFGKSIAIGAAVAIRASVKKEKWAIIAPTKEQAQIIMDYMLDFAVNDPIIRTTLTTDYSILREERLVQRRSRQHITFRDGGEVKVYATNLMGSGAKNIVLDEAGLVDDQTESKIFRMLGDDAKDSFIMKVGNPWYDNHFRVSNEDPNYFQINYDWKKGLEFGRLTEEFVEEARQRPNFSVLYENEFPNQEGEDEHGYRPLLSRTQIKNAMQRNFVGYGDPIDGGDPAGGGTNKAVIVRRQGNYAKIVWSKVGGMPIETADELAKGLVTKQTTKIFYDEQGVGKGTKERLESQNETKRASIAINSGKPMSTIEKDLPRTVRADDYSSVRSYLFWEVKRWIEQGGVLEHNDEWLNLAKVKYKVQGGKIKIISKEDLKRIYGIDDLGEADALSYTFYPAKPNHFKQVNSDFKPDRRDDWLPYYDGMPG